MNYFKENLIWESLKRPQRYQKHVSLLVLEIFLTVTSTDVKSVTPIALPHWPLLQHSWGDNTTPHRSATEACLRHSRSRSIHSNLRIYPTWHCCYQAQNISWKQNQCKPSSHTPNTCYFKRFCLISKEPQITSQHIICLWSPETATRPSIYNKNKKQSFRHDSLAAKKSPVRNPFL